MKLIFQETSIGDVEKLDFSDETWHGILNYDASLINSTIGRRVLSFIEFCEGWHRRLRMQPDDPPNADEFDAFVDLTSLSDWSLKDESKGVILGVGPPAFFAGGEFTCRTQRSLNNDKRNRNGE